MCIYLSIYIYTYHIIYINIFIAYTIIINTHNSRKLTFIFYYYYTGIENCIMQSSSVTKRESLKTEEVMEVLKQFIAEHSISDYRGGSDEEYLSGERRAKVVPEDVINQLKVVKMQLESGYPH